MAENSRERMQAEAQFKKTQKERQSEAAKADYAAEAEAIRAKTARLRALRLAKEAAEKEGRIREK